MLRERVRAVAIALFVADLACVAAAFPLSHWLRDTAFPDLGVVPHGIYPLAQYLPLLPLALVTWAAGLYIAGHYRSHRVTPFSKTTWSLIRVTIGVGMVTVLAIYYLRLDERLFVDDRISRSWLLLFQVVAGTLLIGFRLALQAQSRALHRRGVDLKNVLIVGDSPFAREIAASIERHRSWGYRVLGFITADEAEPDASRKVLGRVRDVHRILDQEVVDEVVVAVQRQVLGDLDGLFAALQDEGVCVRIALDLFPQGPAQLQVDQLDGVPLLTFSATPTDHLKLLSKRILDISFGTLLLLACIPLLAVIALLVRTSSPGPILFRQTRCGLNGRRFTFFKFRTMIDGAEEQAPAVAHLNEMAGPVFKARHDPRVTGVGRWLRKSSLDELPQLWNVLKGDMSLVGPRPPLPDEVEHYERWQRRRLSMRPGLTCLWQVEGRSQLDFDRWMELDLEYIDSWSPLLDLKILLKTIPAVLSGRGAL